MAALIQKPIHVDIYCKQELCRLDTKLAWFRIKNITKCHIQRLYL